MFVGWALAIILYLPLSIKDGSTQCASLRTNCNGCLSASNHMMRLSLPNLQI